MRNAFFLLCAWVLIGCGSSEPADSEPSDAAGEVSAADSASPVDSSVADTGSSSPDATTDATDPVDAPPPSDAPIFPVEDTGPPGACGIPAGTTATASATGGSNVASNAIDGKPTTYWGSGGTGGTLRLAFPKTVKFDRARVLVRSVVGSPSATFTFSGRAGFKGTTPLGTSKGIVTSAGLWLPEASFAPGAWDGLDIGMTASSPCLVAEVFVYDSSTTCTPP